MTRVIKKVLLCSPKYFQIHYQINPWMGNKQIDRSQAQKQWLRLNKLYQQLGIQIITINAQPNLPDMVFTADQGLVKNNSVIMANFRFRQRRPETKIYQDWFKKYGFNLLFLPKSLYFEGGDALETGNKIIVGHGFRTSPQTPQVLAKLLKTPVVSLRLINPYFYHLDTCLFVLSPKEAFYYPKAFDRASQKKLASLFPKLIPLAKKEAFFLTANSFTTNHQVITQEKTPIFTKRLIQLGYQVHQVNTSEFTKAGGGIHCLTIATATKTN